MPGSNRERYIARTRDVRDWALANLEQHFSDTARPRVGYALVCTGGDFADYLVLMRDRGADIFAARRVAVVMVRVTTRRVIQLKGLRLLDRDGSGDAAWRSDLGTAVRVFGQDAVLLDRAGPIPQSVKYR